MPYPSITTKKGYGFFEVASALQKSIRRGDEETALYFAVELHDSNYEEYLWKRLRIITSEDVGLAEPFLPATIQALYTMYLDQRKKKDLKHHPERLYLVHAVLLLCRARKSRLVDWCTAVSWGEHEEKHIPIPDYALDKHTASGRAMGRGFEHFLDEGARLQNHTPQPGEEEYEARSRCLLLKTKPARSTPSGQEPLL